MKEILIQWKSTFLYSWSVVSGHLHPHALRELPDGSVHVSLTGWKTASQPLRWYVQPFDSSTKVRPEPYATMKQ